VPGWYEGLVKRFSAPEESLSEIDTDAAAELLAATADITLIIDQDGVIRDVAASSPDLAAEIDNKWVDQPWLSTVTIESRPKIESLLRDAAEGHPTRWRQVNHVTERTVDLPVVYSAVKVGKKGRIVAVGRDLRAISVLQQRLVDAQQSVDREYARMRNAETRNRLLFQLAFEAVLILDAATLRVVEANPAATQLFGLNARKFAGRQFPEGLDEETAEAVSTMLANVRASGRNGEVRALLAQGDRELLVSASVFREERATLLLVRATPMDADRLAEVVPGATARYVDFVAAAPDGFVVTDAEGKVLAANPAFLDLAQLPGEAQARGESLETWLGRPGVDLTVLLAQLREHGSVRLFATTLRGASGTTTEVELSGAALPDSEPACFGFAVRDVGARLGVAQRTAPPLSRSVEQLTDLVGRVPLKGIVRETSDIIERLCIEAALELTQDNRASAAEMLGLSRQSLYVKLRRYGLGNLGDSESHIQAQLSRVVRRRMP
jgi:transcriptional regulator PpsR